MCALYYYGVCVVLLWVKTAEFKPIGSQLYGQLFTVDLHGEFDCHFYFHHTCSLGHKNHEY